MTSVERPPTSRRSRERDDRGIVPVARGEEVPLSFAQQRIWLLDQLEPTSWAYNVSIVRRLRGDLSLPALQRALDEVVARHEVLRTTFRTVEGRPNQSISAPRPFELTVVDLTDRPRETADAEAHRLADVEARRWFDLAEGPLFRGVLLRVAADDCVLALTMHHIATDAWSESVLLSELSDLYNAFRANEPSPLAAPPIQYADFAVWQRAYVSGAVLQKQLAYWRERLETLPPVLELPADRPRPAERSGRGATVPVVLPAPLTAGLRRVTTLGRASLFMTLLAAFQTLLARYSGQDDIAVGTAIANRTRQELNGLLGFFANTLVLRTDVAGDPTFLEVLARVRETALGAYGHQDLPFEHLVKELQPERTLGHTALFQHMFVFQNAPASDLTLDGVATEEFPHARDTAMFDLTLELSEGEATVTGVLEYATDLYDQATAERFVGHLVVLLEAVVADPERPVSELDLLSLREQRQVIVEVNEQRSPFRATRCIHELFEDQAETRPGAVALTYGAVSLTYRELNERANRLAAHLQAIGVGPDVRVGVCLPRSGDAAIALLAILKAGGAYLPLDPGYPSSRIAFMVDDGDVQVVVTVAAHLDALEGVTAPIVCLDRDRARIAAESAANPASGATVDDLAYVVYTSGSTGVPKGVMIEHHSVVALLLGVDYIRFDEVDALLHMAPLAFDASTFEIWGALLHGRRCVVYEDERFSLQRFGSLMRAEKIDTLWLTSSLFNVVIDEAWRDLRGVRQMIIGGEALSPSHVSRALRLLPDLRLVNGYGPTETTTFAACYEIPSDASEPGEGSIPIGSPVGATELYVLDSNLAPAPVGVTGELYIGGAGLARGYLNRPELTAERFLPHPFDPDANARVYRSGDLVRRRADDAVEFVGRVDDQVKVRGFRVEPGEVEAALREHSSVTAVAVAVQADEHDQRRLVAFVVTAGSFDADELRDALKARLPEHMVPSAIVGLDALPLSPNGKLDRAALPVLEPARAAPNRYLAPSTPTERLQAEIWAEVLKVERVSVDDNFFSLGGDSLMAAVLFAKTARRTGKDIPLSLLFTGPTIREVARALDDEKDDNERTLVPLRESGAKPPIFVAHGVHGHLFLYTHLVRRLDPEQPVFGLRPTATFVDRERRFRIEDLAGRYVEDILQTQPEGPYFLAGYCFGGIVVLEVAHQLEARGHTVGVLALFDAEPSSAPRASRPRREVDQLTSLTRGDESAMAFLRRRLRNVRTKARRLPWLAEHWLHLRLGQQLSERWDDVERVQALRAFPMQRSLIRALGRYEAPSTECPVTLFRAGDANVTTTAIRYLPGEGGTGDEYVIDGPGISHDTLMEEPFVGALANALTERLDSAVLL